VGGGGRGGEEGVKDKGVWNWAQKGLIQGRDGV